MPTESTDTIRGPYNGATIDALGGDDLVYWQYSDGNATIRGGGTGEHYDPNPYQPGNPGGDRLFLGGAVGMVVVWTTTEAGVARVGGRSLSFSGIERLVGSAGGDILDARGAAVAGAHGTTPVHGVSFWGGLGDDALYGSSIADVLDGGAGNDTISAGGGDDFVQSSVGNDIVQGGAGNDNIRWGLGNNVAPGNDTIYGGELVEGIGDLINIWVVNGAFGGARVSYFDNQSGSAVSTMGGVTNTLRFYGFENGWTHEGRDTVDASRAVIDASRDGIHFNTRWGDDILIGSPGDDTLEGGAGQDTITGGRGADVISANGGAYDPRSPGDGAADRILLHAGDGADTLIGFDRGIDTLLADGRGYVLRVTAEGVMLDFGHGDSLLLSYVFNFP